MHKTNAFLLLLYSHLAPNFISSIGHNARLTAQMFDGGFFAFLCKKGDSEYLSV
jgi:hypothetical protein